MGGVGQMNQLLWAMETSGETRVSGEEEMGWRRGGGVCDVALRLGRRGRQGQEKGKGEQRSKPPQSFILGGFCQD